MNMREMWDYLCDSMKKDRVDVYENHNFRHPVKQPRLEKFTIQYTTDNVDTFFRDVDLDIRGKYIKTAYSQYEETKALIELDLSFLENHQNKDLMDKLHDCLVDIFIEIDNREIETKKDRLRSEIEAKQLELNNLQNKK